MFRICPACVPVAIGLPMTLSTGFLVPNERGFLTQPTSHSPRARLVVNSPFKNFFSIIDFIIKFILIASEI